MNEINSKKECRKCKSVLLLEYFKKTTKGYSISCLKCLKEKRETYKCKHNKPRNHCKECGGSSLCNHGRQKSQCKECGGKSICEHNRQRSGCKECGGSNICLHGKQKSQCKECGGSSICEHDKRRDKCRECKGTSICEHNRQRTTCKECGGSSICEHKRVKSICKECGGKSICEHNRRRSECIICKPEKGCKNCLQIYVNPKSKFKPYCFRCYCVLNPDIEIPRKFMIKEHHLRDMLRQEFKNLKLIFNTKVDGGCSLRRPDVRLELLTHTIIIECDEEQHKNTDCENKRTMELFQDLGNRPLVMLRFNPDKNNKNEGCFKVTTAGSLSLNKKEWKLRTDLLSEKIRFYIKNIPEKELTTEYLFYDE